ncbi:MAG TPA: hypothetical protein VF794_03300 [Archangium sp.]|jgi:hypothetical protein|uniref:LVIVD repeat-containing protein n=1 Tax=Archangium sp. TaxID=1872627 RepID=UPI002ED847EF
MNRFLVAMTGALLLASGCAKQEPEKKECQLEAFDLSACDRSGLSSVKAEGIWHVNVSLEDGSETPGAMNLTPDLGHLFGTSLTERQVEGETFFLASDFQNPGFEPLRFALAGCQAPTPERVRGQFRRCSGGAADLKGTFEAVHLSRQVGEPEASGVELVREAALPDKAIATDVFVANGYAYVTALSSGIYIFDVRDPTKPLGTPVLLSSKGDNWNQAWVKDQTLFVASSREGILLYDVSNPAAPKRLKALPTPAVDVWGLYVEGTRLFAMSPSPRAEVLIYDIQTPTAPSLQSRYVVEDSAPESGESPVGGVVHNNQLYIAHWRYGLAVADVTPPNQPSGQGRFGYDKATTRWVAAGTIGARTVVFEASEGWGSRVRALDVTNPKNIQELGSYTPRTESSVMGLTLVGTKLYVAHSLDGLRVLDVSDPYQLRLASWYNTWRETDPGRGRFFLDGLSSVRVSGGDSYLYATDTSRGLLIFREQG